MKTTAFTATGLALLFLATGCGSKRSSPGPVIPIVAEAPERKLSDGFPLATSLECEKLSTIPLEVAFSGMRGIKWVRSCTGRGRTIVWNEFGFGVNFLEARQNVIDRLRDAELPLGMSSEIRPSMVNSPAILLISIDSQQLKPAELGLLVEAYLRRQFRVIPRVADVIVASRATMQYDVVVSAERLQKASLSITQVISALHDSPFTLPPADATLMTDANVAAETARIGLRPGVGLPRLLVRESGEAVRLADVATVEQRAVSTLATEFERLLPQTSPGRDVVLALIVREGEDVTAASRAIDETVSELKLTLPVGTTIERKIRLAESKGAAEAQAPHLSLDKRALLGLPPAVVVAVEMLSQALPPEYILVPEMSGDLGAILRVKLRSGGKARILGHNWQVLKQTAGELRSRIAAVSGVTDAELFGADEEQREEYKIDRDKLAALGIEEDEVTNTIAAAQKGRVATEVNGPTEDPRVQAVSRGWIQRFIRMRHFSVDDTRCPVVVSYEAAARREPLQLSLVTPSGKKLSLGQVADRITTSTPSQIYREQGTRAVIVFWNESPDAAKEVLGIIDKLKQELPPGVALQAN